MGESHVAILNERPAKAGAGLADSAVENVVGRIKTLIERDNLGVGDPLPSERELCEMCSASRTTVREAMRILKAYGVVDVRPKTGAVIIDRRLDTVFELLSFTTLELSRQTFVDTQGFRRLIELGSFDALMERITASDIADLRALNKAMRAETTQRGAALQDFNFHARLVAIVGNRQLDEHYRLIKPIVLKIMENSIVRGKLVDVNYRQHRAIVDALEQRDRLAYQFRVAEHLETGLHLYPEES